AANSGALTDGTYQYVVTFIDGNGVESNPSQMVSVIVGGSGTGTTITLSSIPIGPTGTVARLIYRSPANGTASYFVARVGDNTTASLPDPDNLSDSALVNMAVRASAPVPDVTAMTATAKASGAGPLLAGTYQYRITFMNSEGIESLPSAPITAVLGGN